MRTRMSILACATLGLILASPVQAQYCPAPQILQCGDQLAGNTTGGPDWLTSYSCLNGTFPGPEAHFLMVIDSCNDFSLTLTPTGFDGALLVLADALGICRGDQCLAGADGGSSGAPETISGWVAPGEFHVVVDGYLNGSYGPFTLSLQCTPHPECIDADGDGFYLDDGVCPCGNDCADSDPGRSPGTSEICGDGIDQDCNGFDVQCPACTPNQALSCNLMGSTAMSGLTNNIRSWCGSSDTGWTGREAIFELTPAADSGVRFTTAESQDIDIFVTLPYAAGVCNPSNCSIASITDYTGNEQVSFFASAGQTYYLVVDGWAGVNPTFDWTAACLDESCNPGPTVACGQTVSGTTAGGTNSMTIYAGPVYEFPAAEALHTFQPAADGIATISLTFGNTLDLALMVLEDDGSGCDPAGLVAISDLDNSSGIRAETIDLQVAAGATYYLVVDGWTAADQGAFDLQIDCTAICTGGLADCGAGCVDLGSDLEHCGACNNPCDLPNATVSCQAGSCLVTDCLAGFDDCNSQPADGCETTLGTDTDCSGCGDACGGITFCWQGTCTDQCPGGLTNCSGQCVDTASDPDHCSGCDQACIYPHAGALCVASVCSLGPCDAGFGDCNAQPADGCETNLLNDPANCNACGAACPPATPYCVAGACSDQCPGGHTNCSGQCVDTTTDPAHCGACGAACDLPNTASHACAASTCAAVSCDAGFADCNAQPADGCETTLGTIQACAACADVCAFDHADALCLAGVCSLGACRTNYADCNQNPADGCEADLRTSATCGRCDLACGPTESCDQAACVSSCPDRDGDGALAAACGGTDCDDFNARVYPGATEICGDGIDQDCSGADLPCGNCHDNDADGYQDHVCGGPDCNDSDGSVHPGATEVCEDGIDQDCDGADASCSGCPDADGDGFRDSTCGGNDCDDGSSFIHPGAAEICGDGIDQDCDTMDLPCQCADNDGDGHTPVICGGLDCDDANPAVYSGAPEICGDGIDQDCDQLDPQCIPQAGCGCASTGSPALPGWLLLVCLGLEYRRRRQR